jgi:hypothetical protein
LYDSAGDDTLSISAERSIIAGAGYQVSARGFASITAEANGGGDDLVRFYSNEVSSRWSTTDNMVQWTSAADVVRVARGFERVQAFEQFQPIELKPQATEFPLDRWLVDDKRKQAALAADAARSVFAELGLK